MARSLQRLLIGDEPEAWQSAGFTVTDESVVLGKTTIELIGTTHGRGIRGWALDGVVSDIDGLPAVIDPDHHRAAIQDHANLVFAIDHVVVQTNDFERTVPAFESAGMDERGSRQFTMGGTERRQSFFWAGRVIVEVVGPAIADAEADSAASFWGLALVSSSLGLSYELLGDALGEPKDAVQPGRKIATLRTKQLGISVPIVLMSPHVANLGEPGMQSESVSD